jgi:hypothetical protein
MSEGYIERNRKLEGKCNDILMILDYSEAFLEYKMSSSCAAGSSKEQQQILLLIIRKRKVYFFRPFSFHVF